MSRDAFSNAALVALAASAAILSVGCPGPVNTNRDGGASAFVGRSCNVDSECGSIKCDPVRHQCVCQSDADCEPRFCNNFTGLCADTVNGCIGDGDCTSTEFCDPQTRTCRLRRGLCEACLSDTECGGEQDNCIPDPGLKQSFCGKVCSGDPDCPKGTTCQTQNGALQCWPEAGRNCKTFTGCTPDSLKPCTPTDGGTGDEQCKDVPEQVCDPGRGQCVARAQVCPFGQVCDPASRICVPSCSVDADCVPGQRCATRFCEPMGQCTTDQACPLNRVCNTATKTCVPFCAATGSCPLGQICTITADGRSKCTDGCNGNADCAPEAKCVKSGGQPVGTCTKGACQVNDACGVCQTCDLVANSCASAKTDGYCRPCNGDQDCVRTGSYCLAMADGQFCGQPCLASGCPMGFVCASVTLTGGVRSTQCVPADLSCRALGANKCGF